jgi:hypothetical protein
MPFNSRREAEAAPMRARARMQYLRAAILNMRVVEELIVDVEVGL